VSQEPPCCTGENARVQSNASDVPHRQLSGQHSDAFVGGTGVLLNVRKTVVAWVICLVGSGVVFCSTARFSVEHYLGTVQADKTYLHTFVVPNPFGRDIDLTDIRKSCSCTKAEVATERVGSGEDIRLTMSMRVPTTQVGRFEQQVFLSTDDDPPRIMRFSLSGTVPPDERLHAFPHKLSTGLVGPADSVQRIVSVRRRDGSPVQFMSPAGSCPAIQVRRITGGAAEPAIMFFLVNIEASGLAQGDLSEFILIKTRHPHHGEIRIPVVGHRGPGISPVPERLLLGRLGPTSGPVRRTVRFDSPTDRPFRIHSPRTGLSERWHVTMPSPHTLELVGDCPLPSAPGTIIIQNIDVTVEWVETGKRSLVRIPVIAIVGDPAPGSVDEKHGQGVKGAPSH